MRAHGGRGMWHAVLMMVGCVGHARQARWRACFVMEALMKRRNQPLAGRQEEQGQVPKRALDL
ncbi:hypothetical protein OG21DRAFT_1491284 [Imleria badia]|nr:hypothetical protein OG21DRAFT_1491284 [Imleria badia]